MGRDLELEATIPPPPDWPEEWPVFGPVHVLAHVDDGGFLWVAPYGSPPFDPEEVNRVVMVMGVPVGHASVWLLVGPVDDLPEGGPLGDVTRAFWQAVNAHDD